MSRKITGHPDLDGITLYRAPPEMTTHEDHGHSGYTIVVITDGAKLFRHNRKETIIRRHDIAIANPHELHGGGPYENTPWAHKTWYVSEELARELAGGTSQDPVLHTPVIKDVPLACELIEAHDAGLSQGDSMERETLALSALEKVFSRHSNTDAAPIKRSPREETPSNRVNIYIDEMKANLEIGINLTALADKSGVSRNQVIRDFQRIHGLTPGAYFRHLRLTSAKEQIAAGATLADTATSSGYSDQSHFTRQFRKAFGYTPDEYKKLVKSGAADPV